MQKCINRKIIATKMCAYACLFCISAFPCISLPIQMPAGPGYTHVPYKHVHTCRIKAYDYYDNTIIKKPTITIEADFHWCRSSATACAAVSLSHGVAQTTH